MNTHRHLIGFAAKLISGLRFRGMRRKGMLLVKKELCGKFDFSLAKDCYFQFFDIMYVLILLAVLLILTHAVFRLYLRLMLYICNGHYPSYLFKHLRNN